MVECEYCDEEFDSEEDLQIHNLEEHEDELNSHEREEAKKAKRKRDEREEQIRERRKQYLYQGVGGVVLLAVVAVVGAQLIPSGGGAEFDLEDEPMLGDENASVTLVEFGDFQCPACARFNNGPWQQIKEEYVKTGKVKAYRKSFPLTSLHPWALPAARTMECIYRQNNSAFWSLKDRIYRNQDQISIGNVQEKIISWASEEGVNGSKVRSCLENGNPGKEVREDMSKGKASGVSGTPTIYVNGKRLSGYSYQTVKQAIERALQK